MIYAEATRQSNDASKIKIRRSQSKIKTIFIFLLDYRILHQEFLPASQAINKEYHLSVLQHLQSKFIKNDREYDKNGNNSCIMIMLLIALLQYS